MSKILADHNGGVSEKTFFDAVRAKEDIKKRKGKLAADEKEINKRIIDDGIIMDDLNWVLRQRALTLEERIASHNARMAFLKYLKMPEGTQITFIDPAMSDETGLSPEEREEKWQNFGYVAGRAGQGLSDVMQGHDPNGETGRFITTGWEAGQADLAKGIKQKPKAAEKGEKTAAAPAATKPEAAAPAATEKVVPKHEQEVLDAGVKRRGRPPKETGITYWHNAETKQVFKVTEVDAQPKGSINITKPEFDTLLAKYEKEEKDSWEGAAAAAAAKPAAAEAATGDQPPAPDDDNWDAPASGDAG